MELPTLNIFIKEKLNNFVLYIEKFLGKENKLYPQVKQLLDNEINIVRYAEYIQKAAKLENGKFKMEEKIVVEYLENNGFLKKDICVLDGGNFIPKLSRYMELFLNTICL